MKKTFLSLTALAMICCIMYSSCKKTTHSTIPTPGNTRLLSYTVTSSSVIIKPLPGIVPVVLETYSFSYDNNNRVSQIIYSSNDSTKVRLGTSNLIMTFSYSGSTITKSIATVDNTVVEMDTFTQNSGGLITNTYTPAINNTFQYYGDLMVKNSEVSHTATTSISTTGTYTSSSGNFLEFDYNGDLSATFSGSLHPPITVVWTLDGTTVSYVTHTINNNSDQLTNYAGEPVTVQATDTLHDTATGSYPGGIVQKQTYTFYSDYNRPGDYLQLGSFSTYGANIYQNADLVKSIISSSLTTNITYTIDAQSKITQTTAVSVDDLGNSYTKVYNLQYAIY